MISATLFVIAFLAGGWVRGGGSRRQPADGKIVGGSEVKDIREMPYIVAISEVDRNCTVGANGKKKCEDKWYFTCGGTLLNSHYVITACHCMADFDNSTEHMAPIPMQRPDGSALRTEDFRYVAGSRSIHPLEGTAQIRVPSELHHHPQCAQEETAAIADIGIAKMQKPFKFNDFVQPIKLFSSERRKFQTDFNWMLQHNPHCRVSGWGTADQERIDRLTNEHITYGKHHGMALVLKTTKMDVLTHDVCIKKFSDWAGEDFDELDLDFKKLEQICIWSPSGNEGFCSGDSGSPFVCNGYFIALVSNSMECGTSLPQVCQAVSSLFDWIRRDVCKKSDCSDVIHRLEPFNIGKQLTSVGPNKKKRGAGGARGSYFIELSPILTATAIHLLINLLMYFMNPVGGSVA